MEIETLEKKLNSDIVKFNNRLDKCEKDFERTKAEAVIISSETKDDVKTLQQQLKVCEKKVEEANKMATDKVMWSELVSKEVDSKLLGVSAEMKSLQQTSREIKISRDEQDEISKRKNSIIIHGLKESKGDSGDIRKMEDNDCVMDLFHSIQCDTVSVNTCIRLGKLPSGPNEPPRPLKLVLSSEEQKDKVLRCAKNLKGLNNGMNKVFIHQDLTPKQRTHRQQLVKDLKARQQ
jgi:hypothetical protein